MTAPLAAASLGVGSFLLNAGFVTAIVAIGLLKALSAAGQPTINKRCARSMIWLLASILLMIAAVVFARYDLAPRSVVGLLSLAACLGMVVGVFLAAIGLLRVRKAASESGSTIAWCSLLLGAGCFAIISQTPRPPAERDSSPTALAVEVAPDGRADRDGPPTTPGSSDRRTVDAAPAHARQPQRSRATYEKTVSYEAPAETPDHTSKEFNYTLTLPNEKWIEDAATEEASFHTVQFSWVDASMTFAVSAGPMPIAMGDQAIEAVVIAGFKGRAPAATVGSTRSQNVAGINGFTFEAINPSPHGDRSIRVWYGVKAGFIYQLTAEAPAAETQRLSAEFLALTRGFRLIDPHRGVSEPLVATTPQRPGDDLGYHYEPPGAGWIKVNPGSLDFPVANFAAVHGATSDRTLVVSMPLGEASADLDVLARTLLAALDFAFDGKEVTELSRSGALPPHADGVRDYRATRVVEGRQFHYRLRVIRTPSSAHLVVAFTDNARPGLDNDLTAVIDQFALSGALTAADPPDDPGLRRALSRLINEVAITEYEREEYPAAAAHFNIAVRFDPGDQAIAVNLLHALFRTEGAPAALERLDEIAAGPIGAAPLASIHAELLSLTDRYNETIDAFAALASAGPLDDESLQAMGNAAVSAKRFDEAISAFDEAISKRGGPQLRQLRAILLGRAGRHEEAIQQLCELLNRSPGDVELTFGLAEAYEEAGRFQEAQRLCEAFLKKQPDAAVFWSLLGRFRIQSGEYETSREALQEALRISPGNSDATELLTQVNALLGRGDNRRIREAIEPVELPAIVAAALPEAADVVDRQWGDSEGFVNLCQTVGYDYRVGQRRRYTVHRRVLVLNRQGVEQMTLLTTSFNPLGERLYVNELVVRSADGQELARGTIDDYYVMDDGASGMDTYDQVVKIPVPSVQVGCTIDLTVTHESLSRSRGFGFETDFLCAAAPTVTSAVFLVGDTDAVDYRASGVETQRPDASTLAWIASDPPQAISESHQCDPESYLPMVRLNDAPRDWADLAHEHLSEIAATLEPHDTTQQLARDVTRDCRTVAERIEAVSRHVQDKITYQALEFGMRGVIPHPVGRICRAGTGDCKDHSLLLHHLLREAGVRSHLALVNASGSVEPGLPSLDQFDHMVVCVPEMPLRNGDVAPMGVIDLTQKTIDPMLGIPMGLSQKHVLVLDPEQPRLIETPRLDASHGWIDCQRTATVEGRSDLGAANMKVTEVVTLGPQLSATLRSAMRDLDQEQQRETLRQIIGNKRSVKVREVQLNGLTDLDEPLVIQCQYEVADAFQEVVAEKPLLVGAIPNHWATFFCTPDSIDERKTPFEFTTPVTFRSATRLLPTGSYRVASTKGRTMSESHPAFDWQTDAEPFETRGVDITMVIRRPVGVHPAEDYPAYEASADRALRLSSKVVTLEGDTAPARY
ncbi:tetratricopeptide repeat protein [Botrimarina colliarenosi]|nr:tetratricopeptide repeat protein [Botrimarina colliarenosi]